MTHAAPTSIADLGPIDRLRQQKAWNWYDWANSAYYTTVLTVLFAPYMITVAGNAAGCADADDTCTKTVGLLGLDLAAGSPSPARSSPHCCSSWRATTGSSAPSPSC